MKKITFLAIALFVASAVTSFAQTTKGTVYLGGGLGFTTSSSKNKFEGGGVTVESDGPKSTTFSLVPGVGFFVADKLALGLDLSLDFGSTKIFDGDDEIKNSYNQISFTPYVRKYFMMGDNFGFTGALGLGVGFGSSKLETSSGGVTVSADGPKTTSFQFGVVPGLVFFPTSKVGLEASFGFVGASIISSKQDTAGGTDKSTTTEFGLSANSITPTFSFGFRYYLTK
ncbi:MAG: outer membrane beta-barrel protein [Thermonemataceae bacterium]|nr:outer membrane beta-barrel protein [Thermonemataceae bacterium]